MELLTADAILKSKDLPTEDVDVPEWGGRVRVRGLSGKERDDYEAGLLSMSNGRPAGGQAQFDTKNIRARMAARCIVGKDGQRLFKDDQVELLGEKSGAALDRVFTVALRLSGMRGEDVEELAGNLSSDRPDSLPSG